MANPFVEVLEQAAAWRKDGKGVAIATVVSTWGTSPSPIGSTMAVNEDSAFAGSVSGGCVEGAVIHESLEAIAGGGPRLVKYSITNDEAWEVGLTCGGDVEVLVTAVVSGDVIDTLVDDIAQRRPVVAATEIGTGDQTLVYGDCLQGPLSLEGEILAQARTALDTGTSSIFPHGEDGVFIHAYLPPPQLVIIGAVHVSQALAPMAELAGFDVTIIDPRQAFATEERFPRVKLVHQWPNDAFAASPPDATTAVVALVHDPKIDDPALMAALASDAFYVGALGSRRTHTKRLNRLSELGVSQDDLDRIHAPIGLDLGGRKPAEIAVAILAELVQVVSGRSPA